MRMSIELNIANAVVTDGVIDWHPAMNYAALKIQDFNIIAELALVNGPLVVHPDGPLLENYLGAVNSYPTEFGQVHVDVPNYKQLRLSPEFILFLSDAFTYIDGEASGEIVNPDGSITTVPVGAIAG